MESIFTCVECGSKYKHKKHLTRHINQNHNQLTFECDVCNVTFTRRDVLHRHRREVHNNEIHTCNICNQNFKNLRYLTDHRHHIHKLNAQVSCKFITVPLLLGLQLLHYLYSIES